MFNTATHLSNITISSSLSFKSPYQLLYKSSPDYGFLKAFGCLCYPYLRPYNHHNVDFRSLPCVFIGYSSHHKGYLCYHVASSRIYITLHVVFDEHIFPYSSMLSTAKSSSSLSHSTNSSFSLLDQVSQHLAFTLSRTPCHVKAIIKCSSCIIYPLI